MVAFKNSIIVKLRGGLGNQMFQYAFARFLLKNIPGKKIFFDISPLKYNSTNRQEKINIFNLSPEFKTIDLSKHVFNRYLENQNKIIRRVTKFLYLPYFSSIKYIRERSQIIDSKKLLYYSQIENPIIFDGYWQQYEYIKLVENEIRQEFEFNQQQMNAFYNSNFDTLQTFNNSIKIAIHIRRSDYTLLTSIHLNYGREYYINALRLLPKLESKIVYWIFSDDIDWCKQNIDFLDGEVIFIDKEFLDSYSDVNNFILMSLSDHFIIPNSTYSWWAAWLAKSKSKIVIVPNKWLNKNKQPDIFPENWLRI